MSYGYGKLSTGRGYRYARLGGREYRCTMCNGYVTGASSGCDYCYDCMREREREQKLQEQSHEQVQS